MRARRLSEIDDEPIRYLVRPLVPRGSLTLVDGDPESGKTFALIDMMSSITRGRLLAFEPEGEKRSPETILYFAAEDPASEIRKRALAAGADPSRFVVFDGEPVPITNVAWYRQTIVSQRAACLVLDPLQSFLAGVPTNSFGKVRAALQPIMALAQELDCAIVGVRHLSKASGARSAYRGLGSVDFRAAARSVLRLGVDPRDPSRRVLVHSKHNLGHHFRSEEYEIEDGRVRWLGRSELRERDLDAPESRSRGRTALELASDFLTEALAAGPVPARELKRRARAEGVGWRTVQRAKVELGVVARRRAGERHGQGHWEWSLPGALESPVHVAQDPGPTDADQERHMAPMNGDGKPTSRFGFDEDDQERHHDGHPPPPEGWSPSWN